MRRGRQARKVSRIRGVAGVLLAVSVVLAGCEGAGASGSNADGNGSESCSSGGVGSLALSMTVPTVSYIPAAQPQVVLYGPSGSATSFDASGTFDLPGGSYIVEVHRGVTSDSLIGMADGVNENTVQSLCITDGEETSLAVTFEAQAGAQRLWVTDEDRLLGFSRAQVNAGGSALPIVLDGSLINDFRGFDFDALGNLWAATGPTYGTRLLWLEPGKLGLSGALVPNGSITNSYFGAQYAPVSDVFYAADGTLWLAVHRVDDSFNGLIGYSRATLAEFLLEGGDVAREPDFVHALPGTTGPVALSYGPSSRVYVADFEDDAIHRINSLSGNGSGVDASFTVRITGVVVSNARGPRDLIGTSTNLAILFTTTNQLVVLNSADIANTASAQIDVTSPTTFGVLQLPSGLVLTDRYWVGNQAASSPGELLRFNAGGTTSAFLTSSELSDPVDLRLNPPGIVW
ncbi:MAG: hypothetical protein ACLFP4_04030 [Spirochaetales bacterium]